MKKKIISVLFLCVLLGGCKSNVPKLLEPVGVQADSATVEKGEIYNIHEYDSSVVSDVETVTPSEEGVIKSVNVVLGDKVKAGDVLVSLGGSEAGGGSSQTSVEDLKAQSEYLNGLLQCDIDIAELELQKLKASGGSASEISSKETEITQLKADLAKKQAALAQALAAAESGESGAVSYSQGDIVAPCDGTVVYLNAGTAGSAIKTGQVIAGIAKEDSLYLRGTFIDTDIIQGAHELYALIGNGKYSITNVPYDDDELTRLVTNNKTIYSTFWVENDGNIKVGDYAAIIAVTDYKENVLVIPTNALYSDVDGNYVYVVKGEERERRNITIGMTSQVSVEVTGGLEEGEEVYVK